jgi:hypothetical protein
MIRAMQSHYELAIDQDLSKSTYQPTKEMELPNWLIS